MRKMTFDMDVCCLLLQLMTDFYYVAPVVLETKLTARIPSAARQYLYVFDYKPRNASWTGSVLLSN